MKKIITTSFILLISLTAFSQELVDVLTEKITVNSSTSLNGWTRNTAEIRLPQGTTGFVYRISVFNKGNATVGSGLFDLIKSIPVTQIQLGANLAQYAVSNSDGGALDFFIFTTDEDKNAFRNKEALNWNSCKMFLNRVSSVAYSSECINRTIWFGFRNNNLTQGLDVLLEVAAIIDSRAQDQTTYGFTITNSTTNPIIFQLSVDGYKWQDYRLEPNYFANYNFRQPNIQFRMSTQGSQPVNYQLDYSYRYKIQFNQQKQIFDLFHY